jgi:hypothetical protein
MISQRKRGGGTIAFQNQILWLGLSKSGLVLAPPGHTRTEATELIAKTHDHVNEAPLKIVTKKAPAKRTPAKKVPAKKAPTKTPVKKAPTKARKKK